MRHATPSSRARRAVSTLVGLALLGAIGPWILDSSSAPPADALPLEDPVFSEGRVEANGGPFNLSRTETRDFLTNTANFGPSGTSEINSITVIAETAEVTATYLDSIDIFVDGWVWNGTSAEDFRWDHDGDGDPLDTDGEAEVDVLEAWVDDGGILIAHEDHSLADELGTRLGLATTGFDNPVATPTFTPVDLDHPIIDGPFGTVVSMSGGGTVGWFDPVPAPWNVIAEDDMGRAVLVERAYGDGHVILTADEALFRTTLDDNDIVAGNIFAYAISLTDDGADTLAVTDPGDQEHLIGETVELQIETTGGNGTDLTFTVDDLPSGLSIDDETGEITGTPDTPETVTVEVTATPVTGPPASATFEWTIDDDLLPDTVDDIIVATVGIPVERDLCANDVVGNGVPTVTLDAQLPPGLALVDCVITGTPTTPGISSVGYEVTDIDGDDSSAAAYFAIDPAAFSAGAGECRPEGLSMAGDVPGAVDPGDEFGAVLASGDFNGDGHADLAVGVPGEGNGAGAVLVFMAPCGDGSAQRISQAGSFPGAHEAGDGFGTALAAADFDGDGRDDLAIGVPGEDIDDRADDGNVVVVFGSANGLDESQTASLSQRGGANPGKPQNGDRLGASLAAGDFDGDGNSDLLVGVPGEDVRKAVDAGAVMTFYGADDGFDPSETEVWKQRGPVAGASQTGDGFGTTVATGDFDGNGRDDAVIAAPFEDVGSGSNGGIIHVLSGSRQGLRTSDEQTFKSTKTDTNLGLALATGDFDGDGADDLAFSASETDRVGRVRIYRGEDRGDLRFHDVVRQDDGTASEASNGDRFGESIAFVDLDDDGSLELAVGAPGEDVGGVADAGAVHIYETAGGTISRLDERFRTQRDLDVIGDLASAARLGSSLVAVDHALFAGAPGAMVGSTAQGGSVASVMVRAEITQHLSSGDCGTGCTEAEFDVGVDIMPGTYRVNIVAGSCTVAAETANGDRAASVALDASTAILQITPDHATVIVGASCAGPWFFTSI